MRGAAGSYSTGARKERHDTSNLPRDLVAHPGNAGGMRGQEMRDRGETTDGTFHHFPQFPYDA
jgi:hypothetical protein